MKTVPAKITTAKTVSANQKNNNKRFIYFTDPFIN